MVGVAVRAKGGRDITAYQNGHVAAVASNLGKGHGLQVRLAARPKSVFAFRCLPVNPGVLQSRKWTISRGGVTESPSDIV